MVIHDMPGSIPPVLQPWTDFVYLRFHGPEGDYKGGYTDDFLQQQASMVKQYDATGHTVYAYFNNTIGDAVKNLIDMNRHVGEGCMGQPIEETNRQVEHVRALRRA